MKLALKRITYGLLLLPAVALSLPGCSFDANVNARSESTWKEIIKGKEVKLEGAEAELDKSEARPSKRRADEPTVPTAPSDPEVKIRPRLGKRQILAVFDIENRGGLDLSRKLTARMSDYLAMRLAASGRFEIIPRDQLKQRLSQQKVKSYKQCYDQSCQIEIGRELAAQKTLATAIIRLGSNCTITAVIYDLRKATSEGGASVDGGCSEDALTRSIMNLANKLTGL